MKKIVVYSKFGLICGLSIGLVWSSGCYLFETLDYPTPSPNDSGAEAEVWIDSGVDSRVDTSFSEASQVDSTTKYEDTAEASVDARDPRCDWAAENADGIMVDKDGSDDDAMCGTKESPCRTIKKGMAQAKTHPKKTVFVAAGEYDEHGLELEPGIKVQGGFFASGKAGATPWKRACPLNSNLVVITTSDTSHVVAATKVGDEAILDTLTIKSKPQANPGESLYGLKAAGANVSVRLRSVTVQVAKGGNGANGDDGKNGANGADVCTTPGTNSPPIAGSNGTKGTPAVQGTFVDGAYVPAHGTNGMDGQKGENGFPKRGECTSCIASCDKVVTGMVTTCEKVYERPCAPDGKPGCGGEGATGGKLGQGGGSSIGIFSHLGAIVTIEGGEINVAEGGNGGTGGRGGQEGGVGGIGSNPSVSQIDIECGNICQIMPRPLPAGPVCLRGYEIESLKSGQAGPGAKGGSGGQGGGGSGGFSVAIVKTNTATVTKSDRTVLVHGAGGQGGEGAGGPAANGIGANEFAQ